MRVPDSPDDRRARNEILTRVATRVGIAAVIIGLVGWLANALGVPWWLVILVCAFALFLVVFQA